MSGQEIPEGVLQISKLMGVKPEEVWPRLRGVVNTPEKIKLFNEAVSQAITRGKAKNLPDKTSGVYYRLVFVIFYMLPKKNASR